MDHIALPAHVETSSIHDVFSYMRSVKRGRNHVSVWAHSIQRLATLALISGLPDYSLRLTPSGISSIRLGNVWLRGSDFYGCDPNGCVNLAGIVGEEHMKSTPGGTAGSMLRESLGVDWSTVLSDEEYADVRTGVPYGFLRQTVESGYVAGASVAARSKAMALRAPGPLSTSGDIHEVDMTGAYRWSMMQRLPYPSFGYRRIEPPSIDCDGMSRVVISNDALGIVDPTGAPQVKRWASNRLCRIAESNGARITVLETIDTVKRRPFMRPFVQSIERMMADHPTMRGPLKLICNNAFGKMFRRPSANSIIRIGTEHTLKHVVGVVWEGNAHCIVTQDIFADFLANPLAASDIASAVTERLLLASIDVVKAGGRYLASDTDSIVYAGAHPSMMPVDSGGNAGQWKHEVVGAKSIWMPAKKQRLLFDDDGNCVKLVMAGVPSSIARKLVDVGYASVRTTPTIVECMALKRAATDTIEYAYSLTPEGVRIRVNGTSSAGVVNGRIRRRRDAGNSQFRDGRDGEQWE